MNRFTYDPSSGLMVPRRAIERVRCRSLLMGAAQQALMSYGGAGGAAPYATFVSASYDGYAGPAVGGSYSTTVGDLILLFLTGTSGAPSAPTGWTRILNTTEANGYGVAVYKSNYSASNAAPTAANFPYSLGGLFTVSYTAPTTLAVIQSSAALSSTANDGSSPLTISALPSTTGANSKLIALVMSRDQGMSFGSSNGMTRQLNQSFTYFTVGAFDQSGAQSGSRAFTKSAGTYDTYGILLEIA